jgi:hypothetical protein
MLLRFPKSKSPLLKTLLRNSQRGSQRRSSDNFSFAPYEYNQGLKEEAEEDEYRREAPHSVVSHLVVSKFLYVYMDG